MSVDDHPDLPHESIRVRTACSGPVRGTCDATITATLPPLTELGGKTGVHCRTCDSITHVDPRYHKDTEDDTQ